MLEFSMHPPCNRDSYSFYGRLLLVRGWWEIVTLWTGRFISEVVHTSLLLKNLLLFLSLSLLQFPFQLVLSFPISSRIFKRIFHIFPIYLPGSYHATCCHYPVRI